MNSFIEQFRAQQPNYPASDEELVLQYGDLYPPAEYTYPEDFVKDYARLSQARTVSQSSVPTELGRGLKRGLMGLESTGAGALALASSAVGAEGAKDYWQEVYANKIKQMAEEAPATVPKLEQAGQSLSSAGQYLAGKVGELIPNVAEAGVMALAGTAVAPGPGTEAGVAGGLFARAAARTAIRKAVERTMTPALRKELEEYAAGKIAGDALSEGATKVITDASKYLAGTVASGANFAAQGAGGAYGELSQRPGVTEGDARVGALIAGAGSSIGALIPAQVLKGIFGESVGAEAARSYVDLFAKKIPSEVLTAGSGMGAMEFFNILAEKYADPAQRNKPFSKEDYSRLLNSIAVGALASAPAVALTGLRGVRPETPEAKVAEQPSTVSAPPRASEAPVPGMTPEEVVTNFPVQISREQDLVLHQVANADARGAATEADLSYLASLPEAVKARYETIKSEVSNALKEREKQSGVQQQRQGADGQLQTEAQNRNVEAVQQEEGAQASAGDSLQQAAGELKPEVKAVLKTAGIDTDKLAIAIETAAPSDESSSTPVDVFRQKAKQKALEQPEWQRKSPEEIAADEAAAELEATKKRLGIDQSAARTEVKPQAAEAPQVTVSELARPTIEAFRTPRINKIKEEFYHEIGRDSSDKNASKALGVFEAPDGKIVVATLYDNRGQKVSIPGDRKSWESVLERGYKPIGHIRTTEPQKGFYREFTKEGWADTQKYLEGKVQAAREALAPTASESSVGTQGTATGSVTPEGIVVSEKPTQRIVTDEPRGALSREEAASIQDAILKDYGSLPKNRAEIEDALLVALESNRGLMERLRDLGGERIADLFHELIERYQGAVNSLRESGTTDPATIRSTITGALEGLDAKRATPRGETPPDIRQSRPVGRPIEPARPELAAIATHVVERLQNAGLSLDVQRSSVGPLLRSFAQSMGSYDRAGKAVTLVLSDLTAPTREDIRVMFEEAGHALFDRESKEVQQPILRAIAQLDKMSPSDFELIKKDIANAYPEGAPPGTYEEELLMGFLSRKLRVEGFNPVQARGIVQSLVRLFKELYLRGAMWVQNNLLGSQYNHPELAVDFFRNRLEGFLAGDQETLSWIDRLGGGKPSFEKQLSWHQPTAGEIRETYNSVTGEIDAAPLVADSVEAAVLNLQGNTLRFSIPAPGAPAAPFVDPSVKLNRAAAVNNKLTEARSAGARLSSLTEEAFRKLFGLTNRRTIADKISVEAARKNANQFHPDQRIEDFRSEENYGPSYRDAMVLVRGEHDKIAKTVAADKEVLPRQEALRTRILRENADLLDQYKDAGFMDDLIKRGLGKLLREDVRKVYQSAQTHGAIMQQLEDIARAERRPVDPQWINALRRLYTGTGLQGQTLFSFLDTMANDPGIDWSQSASQIRQHIRSMAQQDPSIHPYVVLAGDSPESRALLASAIGYGKTNRRQMALLALRRADGEQRLAAEQELSALTKETNEQIDQGIRRIGKSAVLKELAKTEFRRSLRMVTRVNRNVQNLTERIAVGQKALPEYQKIIDQIAGKASITEDATFGDKMVVRVPKSLDMSPEWERRQINLNATSGPTSTAAEIDAMTERLAAWTKLREQAYQAGDETAMGQDYQRAKRQLNEIVNNRFYEHALRNTDHRTTELVASNAANQVSSIGTPVSTMLGRKVREFVSGSQTLRNESDVRFGYANSRLKRDALGVLNDGKKGLDKKSPDWFTQNILNAAFGFLEKQQPNEALPRDQEVNAAWDRLGDWLLSQESIRPAIEDRMGPFMKALRELVDKRYESGQFWTKKVQDSGLLVEDPKLGDGILRSAFRVGLYTFPRKFADMYSNMVNALRNSGWSIAAKEFQSIRKVYEEQGPQAVDSLVDKYLNHELHGDTVQKDFLYKLFHLPDESVFDTPELDGSGVTMSADPQLVARAYDEAGGNIRQAFERIYQDHMGEGSLAEFVQKSFLKLSDIYHAADSALKKAEPQKPGHYESLVGLIPNAMIDARQLQHWPSEWFDYHEFDRNDNARMAERVAGQATFGRNTQVLANIHATLKQETDTLQAKLSDVMATASRQVPSGKTSAIERVAEGLLMKDKSPALNGFKTGRERLQYLRRIEQRAPFVDQFLRQMSDYFSRGNQQEGSLRWGVRVAQELASLLVNQPSSAISQLATMFDVPLQWGASPTMLKLTTKVAGLTAKDIAGSLAQAIGWKFLRLNDYERRFNELKLNDPEVARKFGDIFATLEGEQGNRGAQFWRMARDIQSFPVNRLGESAGYTPLRPLAPFFQTVMSSNRALTVGIWQLADNYVSRGVDYLRTHPGNDRITADSLRLRGLEKDSFERFQRSLERYGLDYTEMAQGALKRAQKGDKTVLLNSELARLYSVALNEISLESNIATMPLAAFNNSVLRFGLPLLGWSYRRALQVAQLRLTNQDKTSMKAMSTALLGLAATGLGGLGLSLVVDQYSEDVLGKKRNIRGLQVPTNAQDWVGLNERINRIGTIGLWGELINTAVNVGTGQGDNRMLSVDQRVVAMQSFQGLLRAISAFINQDFDADYQHVVRPAIAAIGGNGLLQYMQIANHAFDIDNAENRVVKRINAENYLRVVGRDLGLSIRAGGGSFNTPTPITPWVARMEYAAYANSPDEFRDAYRGALQVAKDAGKADPADYVKKAFETRHPLRYVFAQVPSEVEYRQILGEMDDRGQEAVTEAVSMFNHYASHIGLKPFQGSAKKNTFRSASQRIAAARARAIGAQ